MLISVQFYDNNFIRNSKLNDNHKNEYRIIIGISCLLIHTRVIGRSKYCTIEKCGIFRGGKLQNGDIP